MISLFVLHIPDLVTNMDSSVLSTKNFSVLSLPIYYLLCTYPHGRAIFIASRGKVEKWDNSNPRAGDLKDGLRKRLGNEEYAKYERAEVGLRYPWSLKL